MNPHHIMIENGSYYLIEIKKCLGLSQVLLIQGDSLWQEDFLKTVLSELLEQELEA